MFKKTLVTMLQAHDKVFRQRIFLCAANNDYCILDIVKRPTKIRKSYVADFTLI